ncbi:hypothetical protein [Anaeromicropila populeti]|uniref:CAAX protease self-immunity n=1 Tax=Anaeromicropila populeti TaxID=37658 RepID=A0A1I6LGM2_9FIRM|nr:hypothetical protein [Anaeromicropila populeti]SFS02536.1 hypothetical protein SAMN05661086_03281 [Anaeromicropila populeti]
MKNSNKYLALYLGISFGCCWGVGLAFILFGEALTAVVGELTLTHPLAIIALYSPSIAGLITYAAMGGMDALKKILFKLIPQKQDLFWFPVLFVVFVLFAASMHYGCVLFGISLPKMTYSIPRMIIEALRNLIEETGLIGGVFGWIGFLLPFFQSKFKSQTKSALLTGFIFGLWVLPGYVISSFGTSTAYPFYVIQLMAFILFLSYVFNVTNGNLLLYIFTFWLMATGSRLKFYYFIPSVQIMQISYFIIGTIVIHTVFKKKNITYTLQTFPDFLDNK